MSRAIDKFSKECLATCPQIQACVQRAVVDNAQRNTPIAYAMGVALEEDMEEGLLPRDGCERGPRKAILAINPTRGDNLKVIRGRADIVGLTNWGSTVARVCSAEFDS